MYDEVNTLQEFRGLLCSLQEMNLVVHFAAAIGFGKPVVQLLEPCRCKSR